MFTNNLRIGVKKTRPDSCQWCPMTGKRQRAQTEKWESEYEEKFLYFAADRTLEQTPSVRLCNLWRYLKPA